MDDIVIEKSIEVKKENLRKLPFDRVYGFKNGVAVFENDRLCGLINKDLAIIAKPVYSIIGSFENGVAIIKKGEKYGAIKEDGTIIVKPEYDGYDKNFKYGAAVFYKISRNSLFDLNSVHRTLIDKSGKIIKEISNMEISNPFSNSSFAIIRGRGRCGLIDRDGNDIVKPQGKYAIYGTYKDMAVMEKYNNSNKKYIIDKNGNKYKFFGCDVVEIIGENLIHVKKDKVHFLTDIYNNKISRNYDEFNYNGNISTATLNGNKYIIDSLGNEEKCYESFFEQLKDMSYSYTKYMKGQKDDRLNIYMPTNYENIVKQCLLDGYKVPVIDIGDDLTVVDYKYICETNDLKLKYVLTIHKFNGEIIVKEFDSKDECDAYYDELIKKIEEYNVNIKNKIKKAFEVSFEDANNSLDEFLGSSKIKK